MEIEKLKQLQYRLDDLKLFFETSSDRPFRFMTIIYDAKQARWEIKIDDLRFSGHSVEQLILAIENYFNSKPLQKEQQC